MSNVSLDVVGLSDFDKMLSTYGDNIRVAAKIAVNSGARKAHGFIKKDITQRLNISDTYVGGVNNGRLRVGNWATDGDLNASVDARKRGTMMSRFIVGNVVRNKPISVMVSRGRRKLKRRAFVMNMKGANVGLVDRVDGDPEVHPNSKRAKKIGKGLFLLYAPSLSQVMSQVISKDSRIQKHVKTEMNTEFIRQVIRLNNGR